MVAVSQSFCSVAYLSSRSGDTVRKAERGVVRKAPRSITYRLCYVLCGIVPAGGSFDVNQNGCAAAILAVVYFDVVLGPIADRHSITKLVKNGFVTSVAEGSLSSQNCVVMNSF